MNRVTICILLLATLGSMPHIAFGAPCETSVTEARIQAQTRAAKIALVTLSNQQVLAISEEVRHWLRCAAEPITGQTLAQLYLYEGMAFARLQEETSAQLAYGKALSLDPSLTWDDDIEPQLKPLFEIVRQAQADAEPVLVALRGPDGGQLYLNGSPVEAHDPTELAPGVAVGQLLVEGKLVESVLFSTLAGPNVLQELGQPNRDIAVAAVDMGHRQRVLGRGLTTSVVAGVISAVAWRMAVSSQEDWQSGDYGASTIRKNHLAVGIMYTGAGTAVIGTGVTGLLRLLTKPQEDDDPVDTARLQAASPTSPQ